MNPIREGYIFAGWYKDIHLTEEWNFEEDIVQSNISLYAKWNAMEKEDNSNVSGNVATGDNFVIDSFTWWYLLLIPILILILLFTNHKNKK